MKRQLEAISKIETEPLLEIPSKIYKFSINLLGWVRMTNRYIPGSLHYVFERAVFQPIIFKPEYLGLGNVVQTNIPH